jgi:hypothetical protein
MALENLTYRVVYTTGQVLTFNFLVYEASQLRLTKKSAQGVETVLAANVDYTVPTSSLGKESGGSVTLTTPIGAGESITLERIVLAVQPLRLPATGAFDPRSIEVALDLLTMMIQQGQGSVLRALVLCASDVDGSGSYRANQNRIQDLGDAKSAQDAVNVRTMEAWLQGASVGTPTQEPPFWEIEGNGEFTYPLAGATLTLAEAYLVYLDGVRQPPSSYIVSVDLQTINFDTQVLSGVNILVHCIGYARPLDPAPLYDEGSRPTPDISILGMRIRFRSILGGPTLHQACELNSNNEPEWATSLVTS